MSYDHPYSGDDSNFIKKHWNGDYSLGKSYWVNTFLVSLAVLFGTRLFMQFFDERTEARYISIAILFLTALSLVVWCWSVIGTWRSASKHVSRGGKSFWAMVAMVALGLGALRTLSHLAVHLPAVADHFRVALGQQPGPETSIQLRADGRSLLVSGGINDDTAEKLQQALNRAPAVATIVLSSDGGWVAQGLNVAAVIADRKLSTYVEDKCVSACTIAFLAGRERSASPKARIGFHSFRVIGMGDASGAMPTLEKVYREAGLSDAFISRVAATPPAKMWYPSTGELLKNGVLTRVLIGGETAAQISGSEISGGASTSR